MRRRGLERRRLRSRNRYCCRSRRSKRSRIVRSRKKSSRFNRLRLFRLSRR